LITVTAEPYDGELAGRLVAALIAEINERYADEVQQWTEAEQKEDAIAYLAEVEPDLVRPPHGAFLVAWLDGGPAGCGALKPLDSDPSVGEIKRMYTLPEARRRGVSRILLTHLEAAAVDLGYRRIQLETGTEQPEAIGLYESHGWHRIEPYGRYRDTPSSVCLAKAVG